MLTKDDVAAAAKLTQYTVQGIGGIAHTFLAPWLARREGQARVEAARADADVMRIQARTQAEIQEDLLPDSGSITGRISLTDQVQHYMEYETRRRLSNVHKVVTKAAQQLEGDVVPDKEPDPDFVATFFNYIQNVSSEQFQTLWAKVLAGEVKSPGHTSLRTLRILRDLDQDTARLFRLFCSLCSHSVVVQDRRVVMTDHIRVLTLDRNPGLNEFVDFNLFYASILRLGEYGLIRPESTLLDYGMSVITPGKELRPFWCIDKFWALKPMAAWNPGNKLLLDGLDISIAAWRICQVVEPETGHYTEAYKKAMKEFFRTKLLEMVPWDL